MRSTITISIPKWLKTKLDKMMRQEHVNRSDLVREALKQYLVEEDFNKLRKLGLTELKKKGISYSDEDIFREVS